MEHVILKKNDTCLTYSLKRIGFEKYLDYSDLKTYFEYIKFNTNILNPGDILLWDKKKYKHWVPNEITKEGIIKSKNLLLGFHLGVYEGNDNFSDVTRRTDGAPQYYPYIRMRSLSEISRKPDYILQLLKT